MREGYMRNHLEDPELGRVVNRYVTPGGRYKKLSYRKLMRMAPEERLRFGRAFAEDARLVTDDELRNLLDYEWRARRTAAWLIGLDRRTRFREQLGELLLASEMAYAGKAYCFALARFGTEEDAQVLIAYLGHYLPQVDLSYDQADALGALQFIDAKIGTHHAARFLQEGGLWHRWAHPESRLTAPPLLLRDIHDLCTLADEWMAA
ncbi:DUF6000 family protein [Amycolatopsis thermophila]|uniref:Uncharacterized protein n=1 Tax=Amycolatopsis thermophila TaxID=206084 RepID=A0ABU0ELW0_9PSEU|nr:DUF6000 family protein [Amycolatopsis thermophila]MDQ0376274.1 hypothetical protein [Amycolatopsis thermophila]